MKKISNFLARFNIRGVGNNNNNSQINHNENSNNNAIFSSVTPQSLNNSIYDQALTVPSNPISGLKSRTDYNNINLRIFSTSGRFVDLMLSILSTGFELKKDAVQKLFNVNIENNQNKSNLYYLIESKTNKNLNESLSLKELNLQCNDELILSSKKIIDFKEELEEEEDLRGPKLDEIMEATKHIEPTKNTPPVVNIEHLLLQNDIQFDIRKILISLAQSSAYVIGTGPYAERLIGMLKSRLANRRKHECDKAQCLMDMGFTKERAIYSLRINNNVYSAALDWLIEHQNSPSIDDFTTLTPDVPTSLSDLKNKFSAADNVESLLEIIKIHSHRSVQPHKEMIKSLVDMGFSEENVIEALKTTRNNQAAACEWLVGIRSRSLTELRDGLPSESPVLKSLLASPQIQISLGNPKVFLAYISMLENYSSISLWLSDNDTSGILGHILRTYHEEKHIIAINQFSSILSE